MKERKFQGGFNPSIVFEGKVQHRVGPLQAENGEEPRFAQLYVHDPSLEASQRFKNMSIPSSMSTAQKENLARSLTKVQDVLHEHNPYVRDLKQIIDIPEEELGQDKIIQSAKV